MDEKDLEFIEKQFYDLKVWFQNNGYMKPVGNQPSSKPTGKPTPGKYPCKKCGGPITWDNYSKDIGGQNYPDHLDENGDILKGGCPSYKQEN